MRKIHYSDLRYDREKKFFNELMPLVNQLKDKYPTIKKKENNKARDFFHLLSNSIRVDNHLMIQSLIRIVQTEFQPDIPLRIFVYQNSNPVAKCKAYRVHGGPGAKEELIILVSQHFFNILDFQEKVAIIGHEVAHYQLGHLDIPTGVLLKHDFDLSDIYDFKVQLLKWSLCAEISVDLQALYLCKLRPKILSNALIKYYSSITHLDSFDMIELLLDQYDHIAKDVLTSNLALHPILPLRIKVIQEISKTQLFKNIGKTVSDKNYNNYRREFEDLIDNIIDAVYPEVISRDIHLDKGLIINMGLAVALADGVIEPAEVKTIENLLGEKINLKKHDLLKEAPFVGDDLQKIITQLIDRSVEICKNENYNKHDLTPMMRFLLGIAASDHSVDLSELKVIYRFGKEFGFSRYEIVIILEQMHLN